MDRSVVRRIRRLTAALAAFALAVLVALPGTWPALHTVLFAAIGICVAELVAVRAGLGNQGWSISLTETVVACALFLKPGPWMIVAMAFGMTLALLLRRGKDPVKIAFNAAMHSATTAAAAAVVVALGPSVLSVCLGMFVCWSMNLLVVGRAISWVSLKPMRELLLRHLPHSAMASTSNTSLGLLAALLAPEHPWATLLLAPPVLLVMWIYRTVWRQQDAAGLLAEIVSAHEQTRTTTPHSIASAVATVSRNALGADRVTIVVLERGQAPSAYTLPAESPGTVVPCDAEHVMASWWARVSTTRAEHMSKGVRGDQAWLLLRVGDADDPAAIVHVSRALSGRGPFTSSEERMASQLLDQATSWVDTLNMASDHGEVQLGQGSRRVNRARALETATTRLLDVANAPAASVESLIEANRAVDAIVADIVGHAVRPGGARDGAGQYGGPHRGSSPA